MKNYIGYKTGLLFLTVTLALVVNFGFFNSGFASTDNNTLMQPQETQNMSNTANTTNATNIVLVHGGWTDGSGWSKEIPILEKAGHKLLLHNFQLNHFQMMSRL
jgi:hypothetical protein